MTAQKAFDLIIHELGQYYDNDEQTAISEWIIEDITDINKNQKYNYNHYELSNIQISTLHNYCIKLKEHIPIQYVLGYTYFGPFKIIVNQSVLIPRPETEELCALIVKENKFKTPLTILDLGTGSGCIPLYLKYYLPNFQISALDISLLALETAKQNAANLELSVHFYQDNILHLVHTHEQYDIIVSNPPYILPEEMATIENHVKNFEPANALFVTNNDPLQFYKAIETAAKVYLKENGVLYMELHSIYAINTQAYFTQQGWKTNLIYDHQNKARILKCFL